MDIGKRIRDERIARGLTQTELAQKATISRSYLGDIEGGRYNPSVDTLKSLATAMRMSASAFLTEGSAEESAKNPPSEATPPLNEIDYAFMGDYKELSQKDQQMLREMARRLLDKGNQQT